jgi:hypothetical protein
MKQREIEKCAICERCVMHDGVPIFYRATVETFCPDVGAIQRQVGLEQMLGGHAGLAAAMGPDEDIAKRIGDADTILICTSCMHEQPLARILRGDK